MYGDLHGKTFDKIKWNSIAYLSENVASNQINIFTFKKAKKLTKSSALPYPTKVHMLRQKSLAPSMTFLFTGPFQRAPKGYLCFGPTPYSAKPHSSKVKHDSCHVWQLWQSNKKKKAKKNINPLSGCLIPTDFFFFD